MTRPRRVLRGLREHEAERQGVPDPDRFRRLRLLGRGGMGRVVEVEDRRLGRRVALKLIELPAGARAPELAARFRREGAAAARVQHPGVVRVHELGTSGDRLYMVQELVAGESLAAHLERSGPLAPEQVRRLGRELADALAAVHAEGVLHRDLKPSNVLLAEGDVLRPRLTDFGLAQVAAVSERLTATGQILGTPGFMAPEQVAGAREQIGPATDIYGLGATLFVALVGHPPFAASTLPELLRTVAKGEPRPSLGPEVPTELATLVLRCLERDPADRFATAQELRDAFDASGEPLAQRRGPGLRAIVAAALTCAALISAGAVAARRDPTRSPAAAPSASAAVIRSDPAGRESPAPAPAQRLLRSRSLTLPEVAAGCFLSNTRFLTVQRSGELICWSLRGDRPPQRLANWSLERGRPISFHWGLARCGDQVGLVAPTALYRVGPELTPPTRLAPANGGNSRAFSVLPTRLAWGDELGTLRLLEESGAVRELNELMPQPVFSLLFLDEHTLAIGTRGRLVVDEKFQPEGWRESLHRLDLSRHERTHGLTLSARVNVVAHAPELGLLAVGQNDGRITLANPEDLSRRGELQASAQDNPFVKPTAHRGQLLGLCFAPDGVLFSLAQVARGVAGGVVDAEVAAWDPVRCERLAFDYAPGGVRAFDLSPDGRCLLIVGSGRVDLWPRTRLVP